MNEIFGDAYAGTYDCLYGDKDYAAECSTIERCFSTYGKGLTRSILDLGCGTGGHALLLAKRYQVIAVDRSADMLVKARRKAKAIPTGGSVVFLQDDIVNFDLAERFDAVLMMFAVLGYQLENSAVLQSLSKARQHLTAGGLFIADVWYGPAVLHLRPSERVKIVTSPEGRIVRVARSSLDSLHHRCAVNYNLWKFKDGRIEAEVEEIHKVRYFFPLELRLFLENAGFELLRIGAFPEIDREPGEDDWNIIVVGRAV